MKAKRAGSGQSGKNLRCFIRASKANCDKALELLAGYRSFPPVGPGRMRKAHRHAARFAVCLLTRQTLQRQAKVRPCVLTVVAVVSYTNANHGQCFSC